MSMLLLSGADALVKLLKKAGVRYAFAYPGTSELVMCNSILKSRTISLINGRGDKEATFMAAGGSVFTPLNSIAILHGARGSTNAAGAIADVRRNEIGTLFIVGLPSTSSAPFLPPHGEFDLIKSIGAFAKRHFEVTQAPAETDTETERKEKIDIFIKTVKNSIVASFSLPYGPIILGIPQDIAEKKWIPNNALKNSFFTPLIKDIKQNELKKITDLIESKKYPLILIDDPYLKVNNAKELLLKFANKLASPILQVNYTRGPMLFEQVQGSQNPYFAGLYNLFSPDHIRLMNATDLLITLNDRNAYERVVGKLPSCRKIAITTNLEMTMKNNYLSSSDIVVQGDISEILPKLTNMLADRSDKIKIQKKCSQIRNSVKKDYKISPQFSYLRTRMVKEFAHVFEKIPHPVLVDDSQMFGGVLAENYSSFPHNLRVFGDHGAFVGGGLSLATGIARCNDFVTVFCTLGDQGFTNALQGLISSVQEKTHIIYIVCNNGKSVSLLKQMKSQDQRAFNNGTHLFLYNPPIQYYVIARSLGISSFYLDKEALEKSKLQKTLLEAINHKGPTLIEFEASGDEEAWMGVWATKGNEK
ncbi:thiamine pyrophosphate-binding protein [Candidatus Roizmanbacteria bacterium]|nr:thiamine pyrophosphate-binding protein [Candidatus Roizmanbacteria bacterium]